MTLSVEDGTGIADADAYVSIEEVDVYADSFGKVNWADLPLNQKEIHVRRATQFIDNKFPFGGRSKTAEQALSFPKEFISIRGHTVEGIPRQLRDAVCELATISVTTDLVDSVAARAYTYRKVVVGDVEKTERYGTSDDSKIFHSVEMLLTPLLSAQIGRGVRLHRLQRA
jgi:hypothetical protein